MAFSASGQEMVVGNEAWAGARASGMGGAYAAVADDISAIVYNPAGLAQMRRVEWNLAIGALSAKESSTLKSTVGSPSVSTANASMSASSISSFGVVFPVPVYRGSLVFAGAYNRVKEFDSELRVRGYSDTWGGTLDGRSVDTGGVNMWSLAGALDVSPTVSLGLSADYYRGDHTLEEKRAYAGTSPDWYELYHSGYDDRLRGWNLHGGMLVKAAHSVRFAAGIRLPVKWSVKTSWYDDWYGRSSREYTVDEHPSSAAADTSEYSDGRFSYHITVPMQVDAGISWAVRGITLSAEVNRLDWSRVETNLDEPEYRYRTTTNWRLGAETAIPFLNLFLRAGYASMPDPYTGYILRSERVTVEDLNRRDFLTLGAGFLADKNTLIDVTFVRGFWSAGESPRMDESTRMKLLASVSWRM